MSRHSISLGSFACLLLCFGSSSCCTTQLGPSCYCLTDDVTFASRMFWHTGEFMFKSRNPRCPGNHNHSSPLHLRASVVVRCFCWMLTLRLDSSTLVHAGPHWSLFHKFCGFLLTTFKINVFRFLLIVLAWTLTCSVKPVGSDMELLGFTVFVWTSDFGVNLLGHPLLRRLTSVLNTYSDWCAAATTASLKPFLMSFSLHHANTHPNTPNQSAGETSALIEACIPADDQWIKGWSLAAPGCSSAA